ncbi:hypothetical protein BAE28_14680 [Acidithiobacillus caldus]|nr:hypothetical protein BAE28_14680 [Acidithiobacillus caldus]
MGMLREDRQMAHLAPRAGFPFTVEPELGLRMLENAGPIRLLRGPEIAQQIHHRYGAQQAGVAQR